MMEGVYLVTLIGTMLVLVAAFSSLLAFRVGAPLLLLFLGIGLVAGVDGLGIDFDNANIAYFVGSLALAIILFDSGFGTSIQSFRQAAYPAVTLETVGVVLTAAFFGVAARYLLGLSWMEAFLLGAIVGSTDAAAVFATLRFTALRRRLAAVLEAESGANDPMAIALTLGLISWIMEPAYGAAELSVLVLQQLGLGLVLGLGLGLIASWSFARLPGELTPFAPVVSLATAALAFGVTQAAGGSGFLAVYVVGLWLGNTRTPLNRPIVAFHQGLAFVSQVVLFVVLGLLVFPSRLGAVVFAGLALAGVLAFLARPLAVWLCTAFQGFGLRERVLLGWGGLRGAVPIVLATFALSEGIGESETIFDAVFFVVLVSALLQGLTLEPLARRLGLATESRPFYQPPLEVGIVRSLGAEILEFTVGRDDAVTGLRVRELGLPRTALITMIVRGDEAVPPRGSTAIQAGDRLYVLSRAETQAETERLFDAWSSARCRTTFASSDARTRSRPSQRR
jgi:potassium/hydrogen antiporter